MQRLLVRLTLAGCPTAALQCRGCWGTFVWGGWWGTGRHQLVGRERGAWSQMSMGWPVASVGAGGGVESL